MTFPASASQNQAHGIALRQFYKANNFTGGEEFWVPIPSSSNLSPIYNPLHLPNRPTKPINPLVPILAPAMIETAVEAIATAIEAYPWLAPLLIP